MKEICIDARMAFHSGIGTYIRNVIESLQDAPFKVRLIVNPDILARWPLSCSIDVITTSASIYSVEEQYKLPFLIPRCDLYWTPHYNIPYLPIRAKKRMVTIHDVYHIAYGSAVSRLKRHYAKIMINRAVKLSDLIITVSQFSKSEILKYTKVQKSLIEVIPLGVNQNLFRPVGNEKLAKVASKYRLPQRFFLFVGNLAVHKNIQGLIAAFNLLKDPHWSLVCVGKKMKSDAFNPHTLNPQILFPGEVLEEELPAFYQLAYATIHPSFYEGFGLTPLEAMSCGCPVIVSNIASLPEVCGDAAIYIDPCKLENIVQGMQTLIQNIDLREDLCAKGLQRSQKMGWGKTVQKHVEAIERIL